MKIRIIILLFLSLAWLPTQAADWEMYLGEEGEIIILYQKTVVAESHWVFWGKEWSWADVKMHVEPPAEHSAYTLTGTIANLGLTLRGTATLPQPREIQMNVEFTAAKTLSGITGGGLEFNLKTEVPSLKQVKHPELLPDQAGWRWPVGPAAQAVQVEIQSADRRTDFERSNSSQIRMMCVGSEIAADASVPVSITITLPPDGEVIPSPQERYAPIDKQTWYKDALAHDQSPVDLSFLNHKPAGQYGFIQTKGDALVSQDGHFMRFWGGNLAAYALYVDKQEIAIQAKRIAQLGYNLMRIHHHDSTRWVSRTAIDKTQPSSRHLDPEFMDRLDYWIHCLKEEGVYVWLDLHVGRVFKEADEIPGFSDLRDGEAKGFSFLNPRVEELMQEFNTQYLNHANPYTGLAYKDDPAIMGLLITNENDLTFHFGNLMLPDKGNPYHTQLFTEHLSQFSQKTGLKPEDLWKTWVPGPSKLLLADLEFRWFSRMAAHLHEMGVKVPIAASQLWGNMGATGLPSQTAGTLIDTHSYGAEEALSTNPLDSHNYITYIATGHAYGMPLSITEWNVRYPWTDRFTAPLYMASIAALQGWDAPMIYNYSQQPFEKPNRQGEWSTFSDPALTGLMPAAALLYRQGHVRPARSTYCIQLDRESTYGPLSRGETMTALRTLAEQSQVFLGLPDTPELDWDRASQPADGVQIVTDVTQTFLPAGQTFVQSDTGEIKRNWQEGIQTIDTPKSQIIQGWIGGKTIELTDVAFSIQTPKATIAITSLDNTPIAQSNQILITIMARVMADENNRFPLFSEPVQGRIQITAQADMALFPLQGGQHRLAEIPIPYHNTQYTLDLPLPEGTHWFVLEKK
ncbi:MAG: hypothetical protein RBU29_07205 [bacterium]|jgi:hypothetical protein|nr:hypothetical protein [bacterium]